MQPIFICTRAFVRNSVQTEHIYDNRYSFYGKVASNASNSLAVIDL